MTVRISPGILLQLGEMEVSDLWQVMRIDRYSFSTPWSEESFLREIQNPSSVTLVATLKSREVVGFICASCTAEEAEIKTLAVRADMRRRGVATALMKEAMRRLYNQGCKKVFLEVRVSNTAARRLYEKLGFRIVGVRRGYYIRPEEDAVVMSRDLYPPDRQIDS